MVARSTLSFAFAALVFTVVASAAAQSPGCSRETLVVDAAPVLVVLCALPAPTPSAEAAVVLIPVSETLSTKASVFARTVELQFLAGSEVSRSIDDVPLARLGFGAESLHITVARTPGALRLEHALLLPGAIPLK
jgi:hypothetical protein